MVDWLGGMRDGGTDVGRWVDARWAGRRVSRRVRTYVGITTRPRPRPRPRAQGGNRTRVCVRSDVSAPEHRTRAPLQAGVSHPIRPRRCIPRDEKKQDEIVPDGMVDTIMRDGKAVGTGRDWLALLCEIEVSVYVHMYIPCYHVCGRV